MVAALLFACRRCIVAVGIVANNKGLSEKAGNARSVFESLDTAETFYWFHSWQVGA